MDRNKIRHEVLTILCEKFYEVSAKYENLPVKEIPKKEMDIPVSELASRIGVDEHQLRKACVQLVHKNEIEYVRIPNVPNSVLGLSPQPDGLKAYEDEYYLEESNSKKYEKQLRLSTLWTNKLIVFTSFVALIITGANLWVSEKQFKIADKQYNKKDTVIIKGVDSIYIQLQQLMQNVQKLQGSIKSGQQK